MNNNRQTNIKPIKTNTNKKTDAKQANLQENENSKVEENEVVKDTGEISKFPTEIQFKTAAYVQTKLLETPESRHTEEEKLKFIWAKGIFDLGRAKFSQLLTVVAKSNFKPHIETNKTVKSDEGLPSKQQLNTAIYLYKRILDIPESKRTANEKQKFSWSKGLLDFGNARLAYLLNPNAKKNNSSPGKISTLTRENLKILTTSTKPIKKKQDTATYVKQILAAKTAATGEKKVPPAEPTIIENQKVPPAKPTIVENQNAPPAKPMIVGNQKTPPAKPTIVGNQKVPPVKPMIVGNQKTPPAKPTIVGNQKVPPAQPMTVGNQKVPPAQPTIVGNQKTPPAKPTIVGNQKVPPAQPTIVGNQKAPPAYPMMVGSQRVPLANSTTFGYQKVPPASTFSHGTSVMNKPIPNRANLKILTNSQGPTRNPDNKANQIQKPVPNTSTNARHIPVIISNANDKPAKDPAKNIGANVPPNQAVTSFNTAPNTISNTQSAFMYPGYGQPTMAGMMIPPMNSYQNSYTYNPHYVNMMNSVNSAPQMMTSMQPTYNFHNSFMYNHPAGSAPNPMPPPQMEMMVSANQFQTYNAYNAYNSAAVNAPTTTTTNSFQNTSAYHTTTENVLNTVAPKRTRTPPKTSLNSGGILNANTTKPTDQTIKPHRNVQSRGRIEDFSNPSNPNLNSPPRKKLNEELIADFILGQFKKFSSPSKTAVDVKRPRMMEEENDKEESKDDLEVGLVDLNNRNGEISSTNWELVNRRLMPMFFAELKRHRELTHRKIQPVLHQGRIRLFVFENPKVLQIFEMTVHKLGELWPGANLTVVPKNRLPHRPRYRTVITGPSDPETILEILRVSNPTLPTYNWEIMNVEPSRRCKQGVCIAMNKESFEPILAQNMTINYAFGSAKLKIFKTDKLPYERAMIVAKYSKPNEDSTHHSERSRNRLSYREEEQSRNFDSGSSKKQDTISILTENILKQLNDMQDENFESINASANRSKWF